MTKQEAVNIKDEILRKEGTIHVFNTIIIGGVVLIEDVMNIINDHTTDEE